MLRLLGALLLAIGVTGALIYRNRLDAAMLIAWVNEAGPAGPLILIGIYAAATVLLLPGSPITLAGGALFGPIWGALYCLSGATLGGRWPSSSPAIWRVTGCRPAPRVCSSA